MFYVPFPRMGWSVDTIRMGELRITDIIQTIVIILYAWHWVCHFLDLRGRQIAKYLSREMATRVQTSTETDTAGKIYLIIFWILSMSWWSYVTITFKQFKTLNFTKIKESSEVWWLYSTGLQSLQRVLYF